MVKHKHQKLILLLAVVLVITSVTVSVGANQTVRGVDYCVTDECKEARDEAEEAEVKAEDSLDAAKVYEVKVQELTVEIAAQEAKIERTEEEIARLKDEIEQAQDSLERKQEALAELLVNVHFESDTEPIKILAGSNSISDLAEKASREQVARQQVSTVAREVRDTKTQLEEDEQAVENLLVEQRQTRRDLIASRQEQNDTMTQYQEDAETFAAAAKAARDRQRELEQAEQAAHPELYGAGVSYDGKNSYRYRARCPQEQDAFVDEWNYYGCECVSYAAWKAAEILGVQIFGWGDAKNWDDVARSIGYTVDHQPTPHSVGQFDSGPYGHVFWVEDVHDGVVDITEYNNAEATGLLTGSYHFGDFGARTIPLTTARQFNYIHF